jgi:hypothetical protein
MAKSKESKITKMLNRYKSEVDLKYGESLINDSLQLSQILEELEKTDKKAFTAFYTLIEKNLELDAIVKERGSRISKLQRGQTQPKK